MITCVPRPALLDDLRRPLEVIEASAGTGKTWTLERIVADLLLRGEARMEEILVVTFTEKAALELRGRIRTFLQTLCTAQGESIDGPCWQIGDTERENIENALRAFDRATITTIHGFCHRVLQEHAFEAGRLLNQELADEATLFERAFRVGIRTRFTLESPFRELLAQAMEAGWPLISLKDLLLDVHREHGELRPEPLTLPLLLAGLDVVWMENPSAILEGWRVAKVHRNTVKSAEGALQGLRTLVASLNVFELSVSWKTLPGRDSLVKACQNEALTGIPRDFAAWLIAFSERAPTPESVLAHAFLPDVRTLLEHIKREEGLLTYSDMIHRMKNVLEQGTLMAEQLRARFKVALVDEFQDTDESQWAIFHNIFQERGRLIVIGDPKQAIYGFRGGDLPTYQTATRSMLGSAQPHRLATNFRSTAPILDAIDHILLGAKPDQSPFFSDPSLYPEGVRCGRPGLNLLQHDGRDVPPVHLVQLDTLEGGASLWRKLARILARRIKERIESGLALRDQAQARPLHYGDVHVLVGKRSEGEMMARALRSEGVPCAFYKQDGLFQSPEAQAWWDVLLAVCEPRNPSRLVRAMLSPFFGYGLEDFHAACVPAETHPVLQRLLAWRTMARRKQVGRMLEVMLTESGLTRRLLLCQGGQRSLTNFRHLAELLANVAQGASLGLEDLVRQLGRWMRELDVPPGDNGSLQRLESESHAVQILTLHMSKGLEAPVVAIFAFGKGRTTLVNRYHEGGKRRIFLGKVPAHLKPQIAHEREEEDQRLLYVAMTRAKAHLILPCFVMDTKDGEAKHPESAYRALNRRLRDIATNHERPELFQIEPISRPRLDQSLELPDPDFSAFALPVVTAPLGPDYEGARALARPFLTTSFTQLHSHLASGNPLRLLDDHGDHDGTPAPAAAGDLPGGALVGQALHRMLETVDLEQVRDRPFETWWGMTEVQSWIEDVLALHTLPARFAARAAELVYRAMCTPLPDGDGGRFTVASAPRMLRELDFLARFVEADRFPEDKDRLQGSIDLLCESGGRAYLIDWKSNRLPGYAHEHLETCMQREYLLQAKIYTRAATNFLALRDREAYEARFGGILYVFLRGLPQGGVWFKRPTWREAETWREDLEHIHREVTEPHGSV